MKKIYIIISVVFTVFVCLSCSDNVSGTDEHTNDQLSKKNDSVGEVKVNLEEEEDEIKQFKNALSISTVYEEQQYEGTLGNSPIYLSYSFERLNKGKYFYPDNGAFFNLIVEDAGANALLKRMKDGKVREQFTLSELSQRTEGFWEKEGKVEQVSLTNKGFSEDELNYFKSFLEVHLIDEIVELWLFEPEDFSNLKLDNGLLSLEASDAGTSGRTSVEYYYKALEINPEDLTYYLSVSVEVNEAWLSMDEAESENEYDLTPENTYHVYVDLYELKDNQVKLMDSYVQEGNWEVTVSFVNSAVVIEDRAGSKALIWDEDTKLMKKF